MQQQFKPIRCDTCLRLLHPDRITNVGRPYYFCSPSCEKGYAQVLFDWAKPYLSPRTRARYLSAFPHVKE